MSGSSPAERVLAYDVDGVREVARARQIAGVVTLACGALLLAASRLLPWVAVLGLLGGAASPAALVVIGLFLAGPRAVSAKEGWTAASVAGAREITAGLEHLEAFIAGIPAEGGEAIFDLRDAVCATDGAFHFGHGHVFVGFGFWCGMAPSQVRKCESPSARSHW